MAIFTGTKLASLRAIVLISVGILALPAHAADDFATFFDDDFKGVELALPSAADLLERRPTAAEFAAARMPGMPLSADDMSRVLLVTDPIGSSVIAGSGEAERETMRQRFVRWITQRSDQRKEFNVFSTLIRSPDEPGMRVDFDVDTEEVRVEYRVGF